MKKLVMAILFVFAISSVAFASPLTDYSKGKAALDLNYRVSPDYNASIGVDGVKELNSGKVAFDGDSNLEWGFTYGIGNNWALQYRQATPKGSLSIANDPRVPSFAAEGGDGYISNNTNLEAKTRVEEYNVLYKLDKNISLFTGVVKANPSLKISGNLFLFPDGDVTIQGHDKNIWQFGLVASKPLNDKLTTYGIASFGSDYRNWEAGLGYKIAKDVELNVNYRDMKVDNMKVASLSDGYESHDVKSDTQIKGWGFGVTYSF